MPRIDPLQLLTCLGILLAPNGGILSSQEVRRLAGLMAKFSKKLVSKCIYIQILKCTDTELLGQFMETGGWTLTHMWLTDGIFTKNWPLVQEILELLLLCPVDVDRLKSNSAPKLVKGLSKEGNHEGVRILATKLVEQWLKIVKGETAAASLTLPSAHQAQNDFQNLSIGQSGIDDIDMGTTADLINLKQRSRNSSLSDSSDFNSFAKSTEVDSLVGNVTDDLSITTIKKSDILMKSIGSSDQKTGKATEALVFKITVKDGKQILAKVDGQPKKSQSSSVTNSSGTSISNDVLVNNHNKENKDFLLGDLKDDVNKERSSKSSSTNKEKDIDKSRDKDKRDKDREKDKYKDRKSSSSSSSHRSSSSSKSLSSHKSSSNSSSKSSSSKTSSSSSSSSRNKDRDRHRSSSSSKSSSSRSDRDKERDSKHREKDKVSQAEKDKDTLAKVMGTSLDKLGKIPKKSKSDETNTSSTAASSSITKKPSISIEVRKDVENRPNTVKKYNSQFRSHGLAEEAPPPPSRRGLKKPAGSSPSSTAGTAATTIITSSPVTSGSQSNSTSKRSSPPPSSSSINNGVPLEKKLKLDITSDKNEKPGSIKLIAPRSKPATLIESDMFMDALCSSASTNKKDVKKRKRRTSTSKDSSGNPSSPPESPTVAMTPTSPKATVAPLKFYQDTLEDNEENKDMAVLNNAKDNKEDKNVKDDSGDEKGGDKELTSGLDDDQNDEENIKPKKLKRAESSEFNDEDSSDEDKLKSSSEKESQMDTEKSTESDEAENKPKPPGPGCGPNGPPGVLMIHRRKGPKKQLKWRIQEELEEIRYFELDETERVNVTKTFTDMKQMERYGEREAFLMARKLSVEDVMTEQTQWMPLIPVDDVPPHPDGNQSKEKKIQIDRESTVLKALYFNRQMIPDSPAEPDMEQYKITDPVVIPLEDGNPDSTNDFTNTPWPDPKDTPPHIGGGGIGSAGGFNNPGPLNSNFGGTDKFHPLGLPFSNTAPWQLGGVGGQPPFGAGMQYGDSNQMGGFNNMNGPGGMDDMSGLNMAMAGMNNPLSPFIGGGGAGGPNFLGQAGFNGYPPELNNMNMNIGMNVNMNMGGGPRGPPPNGGWYRSNGSSWRYGGGGGGGGGGGNNMNQRNWVHGGRVCKLFKKGFCKKGDNCNFIHPNGPSFRN